MKTLCIKETVQIRRLTNTIIIFVNNKRPSTYSSVIFSSVFPFLKWIMRVNFVFTWFQTKLEDLFFTESYNRFVISYCYCVLALHVRLVYIESLRPIPLAALPPRLLTPCNQNRQLRRPIESFLVTFQTIIFIKCQVSPNVCLRLCPFWQW